MIPDRPQAILGRGDEGVLVHVGAQDVLDAPQEVVGLEDEYQLPWDRVQQLRDLGKVHRNVATYLSDLRMETTAFPCQGNANHGIITTLLLIFTFLFYIKFITLGSVKITGGQRCG